jgi:hypothetical protein
MQHKDWIEQSKHDLWTYNYELGVAVKREDHKEEVRISAILDMIEQAISRSEAVINYIIRNK